MTSPTASDPALRHRLLHRLRAVMARTVANGATDEEEMAAARMAGRIAAELDGQPMPAPAAPAIRRERESPEFQRLLEQTITESLLKTAVQELALEQINRIAPPRRRQPGEALERVGIHPLLDGHLGMTLGVGANQAARVIVGRLVDELVQDGQLPAFLDIPASR